MIWDMWKKGFDAWEQATAQYMEKVLTNPGVLGPAGAMLTAAMKTKAATDKALAAWWCDVGLPTRAIRSARSTSSTSSRAGSRSRGAARTTQDRRR